MKKIFKKNRLALVVIIAFAITGAAVLGASFAATTPITVSGRVYDTRTNTGIPGAQVFTCGGRATITTPASGNWSFTTTVNAYYCARITYTPPAGWTGPANNNPPKFAYSKNYEDNVAGVNCYQNTTNTVCNSGAQIADRAVDTGVDFRYTSPAPAPPPAPAPKPAPAPAPKPAPAPVKKTTPTKTVTKPAPAKTNTPAAPDTTSPTTPQGFTATIDDTTQAVDLAWQVSTDNVGVKSYQLERSGDNQQSWDVIDSNITQTNYVDATTSFETSYYYRLKAVDAAGNSSDYAIAQVGTNTFVANAKPGSTSSFSSDDKVVSVTVPSGALKQDAVCSVMISTSTHLPNNKYILISGPYEIDCRDASGNLIDSFNKPFVLSAHIDHSKVGNVGKVVYLGQQTNSSWQNLKIISHDKKTSTDTVNLAGDLTFIIMGTRKTTPLWVKLLIILLILVALAFIARFIVRWRLKRKAAVQYDEYLRKAKGL